MLFAAWGPRGLDSPVEPGVEFVLSNGSGLLPRQQSTSMNTKIVAVVKRLPGNISNPKLVRLVDGKLAVLKRDQGGYEVAAYKLASAVPGLSHLVPETVPAEADWYGGPGMCLQDFISGINRVGDNRRDFSAPVFRRVLLLDNIIGNTDRHRGNLLFKVPNTAVCIDHGSAFAVAYVYNDAHNENEHNLELTNEELAIVTAARIAAKARLTGIPYRAVLRNTNLLLRTKRLWCGSQQSNEEINE